MMTTIINNKTVIVSFDRNDIEVLICNILIDNITIRDIYSFTPDISDINANTIVIQDLQERGIV